MQLTVGTADLKDGIAWAKDALSQTFKVTLEAAVGELKVKAVGREQSASYAMPAKIDKPGEVTVWGDVASKGIQSLSSEYSRMETEGNEVKVSAGGLSLSLTEVEKEEFPKLPQIQGTILPSDFALAVQRSAFAVFRSGDNDLESLKSVKMEFRGSEIIFTATNRYRMARCVAKWNPLKECKGTVLVNASALKSVANSFKTGSKDDAVGIAFNPEEPEIIVFESAGKIRTVQLTDPSSMPETERLFKNEYAVNIILQKDEFLSAFKRVASIVNPKDDPVHVDVSPAKVVISAQNSKARAKETMDATLKGRAEEVDFNPAYVIEGLSPMNTSHVRMRMDEDLRIVEFDGQEGKDGNPDLLYRYILTPIQ